MWTVPQIIFRITTLIDVIVVLIDLDILQQ